MNNKSYHTSVLLNESISFLNINENGEYIDGTLGEGGHSLEIIKKLTDKGKLTSYDHDLEAINFVENKYKEQFNSKNWRLINDNFANISKYHSENSIDGILLDIGISSRQLEGLGRGFSYKNLDEPLDMRMDEKLGVKASDLLNALNEKQLTKLFYEYGEEKKARQIASAIKSSDKRIESVRDLVDVIHRVVPAALFQKKTCKRIFQALRIAINDELFSLQNCLDTSIKLLKPNGRIVVITFHSLEDRIVKNTFNRFVKSDLGKVETRAVQPSEEEILKNIRAHSAKLSVFVKK